MDRYTLDQGLNRVHSNGLVDFQLGGAPVSNFCSAHWQDICLIEWMVDSRGVLK